MAETQPSATASSAPGGALHERLARLFDQEQERRGRKVSHQEVADWMTENGYQVRRAYISALVNGSKTSPSLRIIDGLAAFFGVSPGTLINEKESSPVEEALERALKDSGVQAFALRAEGLSEENLSAVTHILDSLRASQNLPPVEEGSESVG